MAHLHEVRDADTHFTIDAETMVITNTNAAKNKLRVGDHNSEVLTFEIPRYIENHDVLLCDKIGIHYMNAGTNKVDVSKDVYWVTDAAVSEEDENIVLFSWLVSGNATKYVGLLSFGIMFGCLEEDNTYSYVKNTEIFSGITISDGYNFTEAVVEQYSDVLEQWKKELSQLSEEMEELTKELENDFSQLSEEMEELTKELENDFSQLSEDVNNIKQNGTGTGSGVTVPTFLNGLKYYALGDSIVDNQGTTALPETFGSIGYTNDLQGNNISDITVKGYIQAIEEKYGLVCTNYGKAGHTIVGDFSTIMALDYSDVALVTIAYGVNDARTGVTLGTVNSTDGTTFAGALNQILRKIYTDNPECRVIVLTPLQRLYVSEFGIATPNANGDYLIDFVDMCKKVAQKRSTRCIDMYRDSGINQTNLYFYTVEGVHPLNPCYLRMAMPILKTLEEMTLLEFEPFGTMTNTGDTEPDEPDTGGSGSTEEPPTEDDSATTVELTEDMFTVNGMYYDAWGSIFGQNTYHGTEAIETIVGKTYTLITYLATDGAYFGVTCDSADFTTHKGKSFNCNLIGTTSEETIDGTVYKRVEYTWVAEVPYVFIAKKKEVPVSYCSLSYV